MSKSGTKSAIDGIFKLSILKEINGKNAKQQYIEHNKDDKVFVDSLYFLLNPMIVTGISKKKIIKDTSDIVTDVSMYNIYDLYKYLTNNNTGRDIDIKIVQDTIKNISVDDSNIEEILSGIVTKSYKLGVTRNTVNNALPKFIPHFSPMLAKSFYDIKDFPKILKNGHTQTLKLNGIRAVVRKEGDNISVKSREGNEFIGISDIKEQYRLSNLPNGIYDGELIAIKLDGESTESMFRRTITLVNSHSETEMLNHTVFEFLELDEWDNEESKLTYSQRRVRMENVLSNKKSEKILSVPVLYHETRYTDNTLSIVEKKLKEVSEDGYEGIMINPNDAPYIFKRGQSLFKAKLFDSADLLVLDVYEGEGRLKGKLGGVVLSWRDGHQFNLGTGFSDKEREDFWNNPSTIIGKIVEINYQTESENLNGGKAVQFGSFQCVRHDKGIKDIRYSDKD